MARNLDYFFNKKIQLTTNDLENCLRDFQQIIDVLLAFWNCFPIYDDDTQPDTYLIDLFEKKYKNTNEIISALEVYYTSNSIDN